jgi:hypothetical protein
MQKSIKHIYSAFSGTFNTIPEEDFKLLDMGQLPLKQLPNSNCKKCYGRGQIGRDKINLTYYLCTCVKKVLDADLIRSSISNNVDFENLFK